jgi:hypothetical protein
MSLDEMMLGDAPTGDQSAASASVDVAGAVPTSVARINGVLTGVLIGFKEAGAVPLVIFPGQPQTAAVPARTTVDLHGAHIGRPVVLMFDGGDPLRPIVLGCIRGDSTTSAEQLGVEQPGQVEVDVDGERQLISAKEQLVLRCGKASITLTKAGKVLIQGAYVSSRSTGVNRVKGGSVQLN